MTNIPYFLTRVVKTREQNKKDCIVNDSNTYSQENLFTKW